VQVLHDEHNERVLAQRLEQGEQRLEHARLGRVAGRMPGSKAGHDRVDGGPVRSGERIEGGVLVADERSEGGQKRRVGQLVIAELDAIAAQYARTRFARVPGQLVGEARLAYARLTANQCERRTGLGRVAQRGLKLGELSCSPDEAGAGHASGHCLRILPPEAARVPCCRGGSGCRWL